MAYEAIVTKIITRPLPGADKLLIGSVGAYQVVVGIDTKDGELGVFFETGGQLSEDFCSKNDLIRRKVLVDGKEIPAGGMFEPNRRVKSIKLRGACSDGFWCPLSYFTSYGVELTEGTQFSELCGVEICRKYMTAATLAERGKKKTHQRENKMFRKHVETGHFKKESGTIPLGSLITITEKLHGTSQRYGCVVDSIPTVSNSWIKWFYELFGWPTTKEVWADLIGTRNVILSDPGQIGYHGSEEYRYNAVKGIVPRLGEILYGEVVGYTTNGNPIMEPQDTGKLKDKSIKEMFGDSVVYDYGLEKGTCKFYVYRITQTDDDGYVTELSWYQVKKRCRELGIDHVPELDTLLYDDNFIEMDVWEIPDYVDHYTETSDGSPLTSVLSPTTLREGVVVRIDNEHGTTWMKNKGFTFGVLEGYLKESDEYVDAEEVS